MHQHLICVLANDCVNIYRTESTRMSEPIMVMECNKLRKPVRP